jgi:hypothetical protein
VLPDAERLKPARPLAEVIGNRAGERGAVGAYHLLFPSLVYYLGRPVIELGNVEAARAFFADGPAWVIMSDAGFLELQATVGRLCVVERRPLFEAKLADLISGQPPADVLLVSNVCPDRLP